VADVPRPGTRSRGLRLVVSSLRPSGPVGVALLLSVVAMTVLPVLAPRFTLRFVDDAIAGATIAHLTVIALGYLALSLGGLAARAVTGWMANRVAWDGTNRLRERVTAHALSLDLEYHGRRTAGEMIERVDGDVAAVAGFAVAFLLEGVASVLLLLAVVVAVFAVNVWLGVVLGGYCLAQLVAMIYGQRLAVPTATQASAASAALYGELEESLTGVEDIRANGAGEHALGRFYRVSAAWYRAENRAARIGTAVLAGVSVAFAGGTAVLLAVAAWLLHSGALTVGAAVMLFQYMVIVRTPFEQLTEQMRQYQEALAGVARIADLLGQRGTLPEPACPRPLPPSGPLEVRLERVSFTFEGSDQPALSGVDLHLEPGETLGLVGHTGSGKTTLARLLLRLYDPDAGEVLVGGLDLRESDPTTLGRRIGMVTQDVQLFLASIRDNLTLFQPVAGDDRLQEVLHEVGLGEWYADQPDGLDSPLSGMSAGEAQLLAFARVLLTDPGLVVLDEPSSRLDLVSERRVEECIRRLLTGRTGVVIAHRLSSLTGLDKIAVMSAGRILEYGYRASLAADPRSRFAKLLDLAGADR
jgi:ATP-binding cassette, subfamily B, bacterial